MSYEMPGAPELHPPEFVGYPAPVPHWVVQAAPVPVAADGIPRYNCTEYTLRKILRQFPRIPPSPGAPYNNPANYQVGTDAAEGLLLDIGFAPTPFVAGQPLPQGCECSFPAATDDNASPDSAGTAPERPIRCIEPTTECAILFFQLNLQPRQRKADHAIVYEPRYCDWGGKMRPTEPIKRYRDPVDYITLVEGSPANIANYDVVIFCRPTLTPWLGPMIPDQKFNNGAKVPNPDGSMPD